ncbi:uncharacterized protein KQ657_003747 [Scheffersomyces spartinae]|uniref:Major facilitator superfamily (MFS) profile domain-containing protein n=1 Tax=Scheffersomyces spartinae TaxID=45513 RepID=A0A9P7VBV5_9ASCO|nr:uncharacterized protein KQ657_003747 [Scheffersomyces spartinae]KAG7195221.1 hypothetical protein KQ657_003747 [Scheffersomyces spartinae]
MVTQYQPLHTGDPPSQINTFNKDNNNNNDSQNSHGSPFVVVSNNEFDEEEITELAGSHQSSSQNSTNPVKGSNVTGHNDEDVFDHDFKTDIDIESPFIPMGYHGKSGNNYIDDFGNVYTDVDFNFIKYQAKHLLKGKKLVYFTSGFVSLFVSLFGYEQGVCSGIITFKLFKNYFHDPNPETLGFVISILEIGAMVSSILVSKVSDSIGRKRTILLGTTVFILGGTLQSFANNLAVFTVGRVFSGLGVGVLLTVVPLYQCEISPSEERGKLVCGEFTGNIVGYSLSVWIDYFCYFLDTNKDRHLAWRLPLFIQVVIAFILLVGGLFVVELPRWLLDVDLDQKGLNVLSLLYADSDKLLEKPVEEFFIIKNSILKERELYPKHTRSWKLLFRNYKSRIFIGCSALAFAQFNGINIISYYAPMVFGEAGFKDADALLMTGINSTVYLACTLIPFFLVDVWGRKPILILGGLTMCVLLSLVSLMMFLNKSYTPMLVAILVIIYNGCFGYSWGPIGYLIPPEIYPLAVRSKGVSLAVAANWFANWIVGQLTPIAQKSIGWAMYLFPAMSCVISVICVIFYYPETKGIELEDIDKMFGDEKAQHTPIPMNFINSEMNPGPGNGSTTGDTLLTQDSFELENIPRIGVKNDHTDS